MKSIFLMMVFVTISFVSANAQYYFDRTKNSDKTTVHNSGRDFDHFFSLSWDNNKPMSNPNYISQSSSLGFKLGFRKRINDVDRLWVGGDFSWAVYNQYFPSQTVIQGTQSTTTDWYNYSYNYGLTVNLDYFLFPMEKLFVPYVGIGIGGAYDNFTQYYNAYGSKVGSWGVLVRPEIGILAGFKENSSWRLKAAFHFDYASNAGDLSSNNFFIAGKYSNFINTGFQIGIVKMAW